MKRSFTISEVSIQKLFYTFIVLFLIGNSGEVYGQPSFDRLYGTIDHDQGNSITACSAGGYLISGMTKDYYSGFDVLYMLRITTNGDTIWTRTYSDPPETYWNTQVLEHTDHTFLLGNYYWGDIPAVMILKCNESGNKIWSKKFQFTYDTYFSSMTSTLDDGVVICGYHGRGFPSAYLLKTDNNGNEVWRKSYQGDFMEGYYANQIKKTSDNDYILCGYTEIGGTEIFQGLLIKTDTSGNLLWSKRYESPTYYKRTFNDIVQDSVGSYIIAGFDSWSNEYDSPHYPFLMKTTPDGTQIWFKYTSKEFRSITVQNSGSLILTTAISDIATIARANGLGNITWSVNISSKYSGSTINQIIPSTEGGFIMTGKALSNYGYGGRDVLIMKSDEYGIITEMHKSEKPDSDIQIWPNPCYDNVEIKSKSDIKSVSVYNAQGSLLIMTKLKENTNQFSLRTVAFPAGLLIFKVETSQNSYIEKTIKL
jgi:hypothetical protein